MRRGVLPWALAFGMGFSSVLADPAAKPVVPDIYRMPESAPISDINSPSTNIDWYNKWIANYGVLTLPTEDEGVHTHGTFTFHSRVHHDDETYNDLQNLFGRYADTNKVPHERFALLKLCYDYMESEADDATGGEDMEAYHGQEYYAVKYHIRQAYRDLPSTQKRLLQQFEYLNERLESIPQQVWEIRAVYNGTRDITFNLQLYHPFREKLGGYTLTLAMEYPTAIGRVTGSQPFIINENYSVDEFVDQLYDLYEKKMKK